MSGENDNKSTNGSNSPYSDLGAGDLMEKEKATQPTFASFFCPSKLLMGHFKWQWKSIPSAWFTCSIVILIQLRDKWIYV